MTKERFHLRKLLITAWEVKTFTLSETSNQLFTLIKQHVWGVNEQIMSRAIYYGQSYEHNAFIEYQGSKTPMGFKVEEAGL